MIAGRIRHPDRSDPVTDSRLFRSAPILSEPLIRDLDRMNPWWSGDPQKPLPTTRRHLVETIRARLQRGLAPAVVVRGPRQVGKTMAQLQLIQDHLEAGFPPTQIFRVQFDDLPEIKKLAEPVLTLVSWFEHRVLGRTLNAAARDGTRALLFFDEVQNLPDWAEQLKSLVDNSSVQVVVTGSSALRIERGRDSLAGRITTIEAGTLSLTEIGRFRGVELGDPFLADGAIDAITRQETWLALRDHGRAVSTQRDEVFAHFAERGGYPLVHNLADEPWGAVAGQLNETVIRRVIQHDLRVGERGRKRDEALLEGIFRLACRYAGQSPGPTLLAQEVQRSLSANIGQQRVRSYLRFLDEALLVRLVQPLEIRLKKTRGYPKICLADHGLRASWLQEAVPLDPARLLERPDFTSMAGHIAESIAGACLSTVPELQLSHLPARGGAPEVDFVLTVGSVRIPVEVKYQRRIDSARDTVGLRTFMEKTANNATFGLLVTQVDVDLQPLDPRIVCLPLSSLLLLG